MFWKGRHWKARLICSCSVPLATVLQTVRNLGQPLNIFCELLIARCLRSGLMRFRHAETSPKIDRLGLRNKLYG